MILDIILKIMAYLEKKYSLKKIACLSSECREISRRIDKKFFFHKRSKLYQYFEFGIKCRKILLKVFCPSSFRAYYPEAIKGSISFNRKNLEFWLKMDIINTRYILMEFDKIFKKNKLKPGDLIDFGYKLGIFLYDGEKFVGDRSNIMRIAPVFLPKECWKWTEKYGIEFWGEIINRTAPVIRTIYLPIGTNDKFIIKEISKKKQLIEFGQAKFIKIWNKIT